MTGASESESLVDANIFVSFVVCTYAHVKLFYTEKK